MLHQLTCETMGAAIIASHPFCSKVPKLRYRLPAFGTVAGVSPCKVQWTGLALGKPPS